VAASTTLGHETGGGMVRTPRDFGMEPGGRFLIVANQGTNNVIVFRIDATTGTLTRVGDPLSSPRARSSPARCRRHSQKINREERRHRDDPEL
jgi:DNA-binding beta-propeller fold protein YncE